MRTIEVDFELTSDDRLVCCHDWEKELSSEYGPEYVYSKDEFMNIRIFDQYTPLSLESVLELMKTHDDVWIVTDTKATDKETVQKEFGILLETAEKTDSLEVLDRFVVQLYNYEMYDTVEEIYSFPNYILTLYKMGGLDQETFIQHCRFCKNRGIGIITMKKSWFKSAYAEIADQYDIAVYVHTVNDMDDVDELQGLGVTGFYTDYVLPEYLLN